MSDLVRIVLLIAAVVCGVAVLLIAAALIQNSILLAKGQYGWRKVRGVLKRFASIRSFRVLSNLDLPHGSGTVHVENMLIGFFGIIFTESISKNGEYYGELKGERWIRITDKERTEFPNPLLRGEQAMSAVRELFSKDGLYRVPMEQFVVVARKSKKLKMYIGGAEIVSLAELKKQLGKVKYEKDNNVDVDRISRLVLAAAVQKA